MQVVRGRKNDKHTLGHGSAQLHQYLRICQAAVKTSRFLFEDSYATVEECQCLPDERRCKDSHPAALSVCSSLLG